MDALERLERNLGIFPPEIKFIMISEPFSFRSSYYEAHFRDYRLAVLPDLAPATPDYSWSITKGGKHIASAFCHTAEEGMKVCQARLQEEMLLWSEMPSLWEAP